MLSDTLFDAKISAFKHFLCRTQEHMETVYISPHVHCSWDQYNRSGKHELCMQSFQTDLSQYQLLVSGTFVHGLFSVNTSFRKIKIVGLLSIPLSTGDISICHVQWSGNFIRSNLKRKLKQQENILLNCKYMYMNTQMNISAANMSNLQRWAIKFNKPSVMKCV